MDPLSIFDTLIKYLSKIVGLFNKPTIKVLIRENGNEEYKEFRELGSGNHKISVWAFRVGNKFLQANSILLNYQLDVKGRAGRFTWYPTGGGQREFENTGQVGGKIRLFNDYKLGELDFPDLQSGENIEIAYNFDTENGSSVGIANKEKILRVIVR